MRTFTSLTYAINELIGEDLKWEYGDGFAELVTKRGDADDMRKARFAVQLDNLYNSCFYNGVLKENLSDSEKIFMDFWNDDGFNSAKRSELIAKLREVPKLKKFIA
jgi:hypothetical protein